jgi:signal transduction histidine kinase
MRQQSNGTGLQSADAYALLPYVADLELEVDRLRKQDQFVRHEAWDALKRIQSLCSCEKSGDTRAALTEVGRAATEFAAVLRDLFESPGYHPAHDQVVAIALRPLVEQVFRRQQRLVGAPEATLRLELESEHVEWFPARLRHILDNLISNALKYRDPGKSETVVGLGLRVSPTGYELRLADNGVGLSAGDREELLGQWGHFPQTLRKLSALSGGAASVGVGLAVVKMLVEQSGGTVAADSDHGQGTVFVAVLPRYDVDDYLR